jgi:carboxypeptidase C (cathepsin A)
MELNPYLKVFCAGGYYDSVTPFLQTVLDLENMPLGNPESRQNLVFRTYPSGHMIYLDNLSRSAMKADLGAFYHGIRAHLAAATAETVSGAARRISRSPYRRRFNRTPY